jgi:hypothetical protein
MSQDKHLNPDGAYFLGVVRAAGGFQGVTRASLTQEDLTPYPLLPEEWRVHDALGTNLPNTPASDDLGIIAGTIGTDLPYVWAGDQKNNAGANTRYARRQFRLPPEYVAGGAIRLRMYAGMLTTIASAAATLDAQVFASDGAGGVGSDICTTSAININTPAAPNLADRDFTINPSGLIAGDVLDIRIAVTVNDTATATAVDAVIQHAALLLSIKG